MTAYQYQLLPDLDADEYESLKADIAKRGIQVPVEVDENGAILDGHQRVRAWTELLHAGRLMAEYPRIVRVGLSEDKKFEHALILNLNRRHLTREQRQELTVKLRERGWSTPKIAEVEHVSDETVRRDLAGSTYVEPASVTGQDGKTYPAHRSARSEVETADSYPFMNSADWSQTAVLEAGKALAEMDEPSREVVTALVSQPGVLAPTALSMIKNVAEMEPEQRAEVVNLYQSDDPRDKSLAETKAANIPPDPDPRYVKLGILARELRACAGSVPADEFTPLIHALAVDADAIRGRIQATYRERVNGTALPEA